MGRVDHDTLRRRRFAGLCLLAAFLAAGLALNGWTLTPMWSVLAPDEGEFVAGDPFDEWIYAVCDGERQQITVGRDGRLAGADGLASLRRVRFPDWCGLPTVDNPDLKAWQGQLARLQSLTGTPGVPARRILDAAREMPISYLYLEPLSAWIHADYSNAVAFLDALAERPMRFDHPNHAVVLARQQAFSGLIDDALQIAASRDVAGDRLERWLSSSQIAGRGRALQRLLAAGPPEGGASAAMLEHLESVPLAQRGEAYSTLAPRLVHDGRYAALLTEQLRHLPPHTRSFAVRQMLSRPDVSTQLPIALLSSFGSLFDHAGPDAHLDVFIALADKLQDEPGAAALLTSHLRDIPGMQRRLAANHLLRLDGAGESDFALTVIRALGDFHPISRPKLAQTVIQSPQFDDPAVQEACLLAVRLQMRGRERDELFLAMLHHPALAPELQASIRAELG
ncbi:MAG TPA: hypothetical protein VF322_01420 [Gammaproteobacteria bacterium]